MHEVFLVAIRRRGTFT